MLVDRLGASQTTLLLVVVSSVGVYAAVLALTRLAGVRSLAKMSTFDFAATVAVGSTLSSTVLGTASLAAGALGLGMLFGLQYAVATVRRRGLLHGILDSSPILLLAHGQAVDENLRHARVSRAELWAQLRLAGVQRLEQVQAVVMETTGDLSVLRVGEEIEPILLEGVRGAERLA